MAWSPLSARISSISILLAGPIIRRAERESVTVWFVLSENRNVTFNIYAGNSGGAAVLTGTRSSGVQIGDRVVVYCVTARGGTLNTGTNYYYDIDFGGGSSLGALIGSGLSLTYDGSNRPGFALAPDNLDQVRLVHGSCRKPHGEGYDALEGVNEMINAAVSGGAVNATNRPHQLLLTGDQIYADDVADVLLYMINDAASILFNWDENYSPFTADELRPGNRNANNRLENDVGFTGMLPGKPEYSKSHLLKFREYALMYLFVWSDVLWPANDSDLPSFSDLYSYDTSIREYAVLPNLSNPAGTRTAIGARFNNEKQDLIRFKSTIPAIRKALANIPVFMIFDDHEITDDWNLNWRWCKTVYSKPLGRRTVQNGLLAFTLFQAWGNTPAQFDASGAGAPVLSAANSWRGANDAHFQTFARLFNIPDLPPLPASESAIASMRLSADENLLHATDTISWHYDYVAANYAIYVQDSRTWRNFPRGALINFAGLINQSGFDAQIPNPLPQKDIYIVVAPCPVIGVPFIEEQQKDAGTWEDRCDKDCEAWSLNEGTFEKLFSVLASRLPVSGSGASRQRNGRFAFLSGDVHYGLSARYQVWGNNFIGDTQAGVMTNAVFAQLTASSCKNQTAGLLGTETLHYRGYPHSVAGEALSLIPGPETEALPDTWQRFAWIITTTDIVGRFRPGTPSGVWNYGPVSSGLLVRSLERLTNDHVEILTLEPNWRYRVDWLLARNTGADTDREATPRRITISPSISDRATALQSYIEMSEDHDSYVGRWGDGKEIVGMNNIGEIRFDFSGTTKRINHVLWWRMRPRGSAATPLQVFPLSRFIVPMGFSGDMNSLGQNITAPAFSGISTL